MKNEQRIVPGNIDSFGKTMSLENIINTIEHKAKSIEPNTLVFSNSEMKHKEYYLDNRVYNLGETGNRITLLDQRVFYRKTDKLESTGLKNIEEMILNTINTISKLENVNGFFREINEFLLDSTNLFLLKTKFAEENPNIYFDNDYVKDDKVYNSTTIQVLKRIDSNGSTNLYRRNVYLKLDLLNKSLNGFNENAKRKFEDMVVSSTGSLHNFDVKVYGVMPYFLTHTGILLKAKNRIRLIYGYLEGKKFSKNTLTREAFIEDDFGILLNAAFPSLVVVELTTSKSTKSEYIILSVGQTVLGVQKLGKVGSHSVAPVGGRYYIPKNLVVDIEETDYKSMETPSGVLNDIEGFIALKSNYLFFLDTYIGALTTTTLV